MSTLNVSNLKNPSASSPGLVLNADGTCSQLGFRNALINGNPIINQRGYASGTATSGANQYTLDRWRVVTSGQSITFSDSANVRTVTAPAGGIEQVIEGLNILSGTYVLNWTGTATATVDGASVVKGGTVTLTGGTNATVRFIGGTFSLAQLEPGTVATPFERRSYGQELALCERYYQKLLAGVTVPSTTNTGNYTFTTPFRAVPRTSSTSLVSYANTSYVNASSLTCVAAGTYGVESQWISSVNGFAGVHYTDIIINAEF